PPRPAPRLFPYTTLFRSHDHDRVAPLVRQVEGELRQVDGFLGRRRGQHDEAVVAVPAAARRLEVIALAAAHVDGEDGDLRVRQLDRKSTRLNSSHVSISY